MLFECCAMIATVYNTYSVYVIKLTFIIMGGTDQLEKSVVNTLR